MEVQEKKHAPASGPPARPGISPGAAAAIAVTPHGSGRVAEAAPAPIPAPATARPAAARAQPLPERFLAWVDAHRWRLLAGLLALYALGFNGQWRIEPDSALYLTIGRNLAEGRGYTYHGAHHHLAYPGLPWLFAANFKLFGAHSLLPAHLIILGSGLATLALTYRLFYLHAGRPTAVLLTLGLGLSRTFYRYCFELLSDVPFLMGVMAFLVGYEAIFFRRYEPDVRDGVRGNRGKPRWFDWLLLVGGLAVAMVMRPTMWALLLAVVGAVAVSMFRALFRRPVRVGRLAVGAGLLAAAVAAGVVFYSLDPRRTGKAETTGDYEIAFLDALTKDMDRLADKALRTNLPALFHPAASEAVFGIDFGHVDVGRYAVSVSLIPSMLAIGAGLFLFPRRLLWGVWVAVTLLMMLLTVVHVRYFLQVLPLLLYGWWLGVLWLHRKAAVIAAREPERGAAAVRWAGIASVVAVAGLVGLNVVRVGSLIAEQRRAPFLAHYRDGKYAAAPRVAEVIRSQTPQGAWVLVPQKLGRVLTYLSGRYAVEPGPATLLDPAEQPVYVVEPMDPVGKQWMEQKRIDAGPAVGETIPDRRGKTWQVRRAVRAQPS